MRRLGSEAKDSKESAEKWSLEVKYNLNLINRGNITNHHVTLD